MNAKAKTYSRLRLAAGALVVLGLGMLLGRGSSDSAVSNVEAHAHAEVWTCSMHPQIRSDGPGACPICGMDLVPVEAEEKVEGAPVQVRLSERARALARVRTTAIARQPLAGSTLSLLGRVVPDERSLRTVTSWIGGRIERLLVNATGERISSGEAVAMLYSPEVFAAHQDLRVALEQQQRTVGSSGTQPGVSGAAAKAAASGVEAARERLRLLGIPEREVDRMAQSSAPTRSVRIRAPFAGTVLERLASEGAYVQTGSPLYRVARLDHLWILLDAYESDLARLSEGQRVVVRVEALPGEEIEGKVTFIDPTVNPTRRTIEVRVEVDNRDHRLRPGMYAEATVYTDPVESEKAPLMVPTSAPLFTGRRSLVYVEVPDTERPTYVPREVRLGPKGESGYPVISGLEAGERVVVQGAFALDADLQIRGGPSMMSPTRAEASEEIPPVVVSTAGLETLGPVVHAYLGVQEALAEDTLADAAAAATALSARAAEVELGEPEAAAAWRPISDGLRLRATRLSRAGSLEEARESFEGLSEGLEQLLSTFGNPTDIPLRLAFCPMAMGSEGATWVQSAEKIDNAYFGASMRTCGEIRAEAGPGERLGTEGQP